MNLNFKCILCFTEKERDDETKHKGDYSQSPRHWFSHITGLVYNLFKLNIIVFPLTNELQMTNLGEELIIHDAVGRGEGPQPAQHCLVPPG